VGKDCPIVTLHDDVHRPMSKDSITNLGPRDHLDDRAIGLDVFHELLGGSCGRVRRVATEVS